MRSTLGTLAGLSAALLVVLLVWASPGSATTLTVTDLGDSGAPGQFRTLINGAAPGDTIVIPAGTITLTGAAGDDNNLSGDLDIHKDLTIQGAGPGVTILDGGGIDRVFEISSGNIVFISRVTIRNGNAGAGGFGGGIVNRGTLTLTGSVVSDNMGSYGGGVENGTGGVATLTGVTIRGNTAASGGGIVNRGTLTLINSTVSGNKGSFVGGIVNSGILTLLNSTVSDNMSSVNGGGVENDIGAAATLTGVTISGNTAGRNGGGMRNKGALAVTNSTISGNIAMFGSGGGINNGVGGTAMLTNVTISGNVARGGVVGDIDNHDSVTLKNTIVANSVSGGNCSGTMTSLGHSLDSGSTCGFTGPGDKTASDPLLGPLGNNGGPTQTHALLPGSLAIDAGDDAGCPATDQRGIARPQGRACDIGAYEAAAGDLGPPSKSP